MSSFPFTVEIVCCAESSSLIQAYDGWSMSVLLALWFLYGHCREGSLLHMAVHLIFTLWSRLDEPFPSGVFFFALIKKNYLSWTSQLEFRHSKSGQNNFVCLFVWVRSPQTVLQCLQPEVKTSMFRGARDLCACWCAWHSTLQLPEQISFRSQAHTLLRKKQD